MTQITWQIEWMNTTPTTATPPECVLTAGWRCTGVDGEFSGSVYSTCSFPQPGDPFVPYSQLTEATVLDWCWTSGVNKEATEAAVQANIDNQREPKVIQPPLPWSA